MSSWDTSSGLLDAFTLQVEEAWFGKNDKFGDNLLLNLQGAALVDGDVVDPEHTEIFTCGATWKAGQGGAMAVSTTGAEMFNQNSKIGRLIDSIVGLGDEAIAIMSGRGESYEAESWTNIAIDFERTKVGTYEDRDTGETKDSFALLAVGLAEVGEEKPKAKKAKKAKKDKGSNGSKGLRALVLAHAKKYDDNDEFVAGVLDSDTFKKAEDVEADEELLDAILDGSIFEEAH